MVETLEFIKILRGLTKMLKRSVAEILKGFDDSEARKMLRAPLDTLEVFDVQLL